MKRIVNNFFISILLLGVIETANSFDLTKTNLEYQYDVDAEMKFDHRLVDMDDSLRVFFAIHADTSRQWSLTLLLQKGYDAIDHDTLNLASLNILATQKRLQMATFSMVKPSNADLLLFVFYDQVLGKSLFYDIHLVKSSLVPSFYPTDNSGLPIMKSYVTTQKVTIKGAQTSLLVYEYSNQFQAADPAMGQMKPLAPKLDINTSYYFKDSLTTLSPDKFYLIQEDSVSELGIVLLKVPAYYPEMKRIEELVGAMRYITTDDEYQTLTSGQNTKANFERFWINTYGSKFRAKGAIRSFFKQVEASNILFTDYKAGWKTDRGIIYIVFGKPEMVTRDVRSEVWKYSNGLTFEFIRISTLFAPSMYALKRDLKYEEVWYNRVGSMRK